MVLNQKSFGSGGTLALLAAAAWLAACSPEASPGGGGSGGSGGSGGRGGSGGSSGRGGSAGGSSGQGGSATAGSGGSMSIGTGGSMSTGTGGSSGQGGTGGSAGSGGSAGAGGAGGSGSGDAGGGDAGGDMPTSPIPGYALCVPCHGPEGAGVPMMGPEILHPVVDFSTWVVRNGRTHPGYKLPMMKYTPDILSDAQLQGIFAFLAAKPKPTTGAGLYKDYCENCHGPDALGGVTMRPIANEPVNVFIMDSRAGHHPGEFDNRREYMPKWTAAELSDAELRSIFMYVDGL
jgi:mono/diheme cytochrome c family protein